MIFGMMFVLKTTRERPLIHPFFALDLMSKILPCTMLVMAMLKLSCTGNGHTKNGLALFIEASIERFEPDVSVPVMVRGLEQLISNASLSLQELLSQGFKYQFEVHYK